MNSVNWGLMYQMNIDEANTFFEENILEIIDKMAPLVKIQPKKQHCAWITRTTKDLMNLRDLTREQARTTKDQQKWNDYKALRNRCSVQNHQEATRVGGWRPP